LVGLADAMDYVVMQNDEGYFVRFLKEEVPVKKKGAVGVRGMKIAKKGIVENAYLVANRMECTISYKEREVVLNKLKLAKRDTRGTKVRV